MGQRIGRAAGPAFLVAFLWTLVAPSNVAAQFGAAVDLSAPGVNSGNASVSVDPAGTATTVWETQAGVVQARMLTAAGALGPIQDLSPAGVTDGPATFDPAGNAIAVWTLTVGPQATIQARRLAADGTLGAVVDVSPPGAAVRTPAVALDPAGNATVVWDALPDGDTRRKVLARRISATDVLGTVLELWQDETGPQPRLLSAPPGVGVDAAGIATVVFTTSRGSFIQAFGADFFSVRRVAVDESLGPLIDVLSIGHSEFEGARAGVVVDPNGTATVIMTSDSASGGFNGTQARRVFPDGTLGTTHPVFGCVRRSVAGRSSEGRTTLIGSCTTVVPGGGTFQSRLVGQRIGADDVSGPTFDLSDNAAFVDGRFAPNVMDRLTVVWSRTNFMDSRLQGRQLFPNGQLGAVLDITPSSASKVFSGPAVAADSTGQTTLVWTLIDPATAIVQAAQGVVPVFADVTSAQPVRTFIEALFQAGITGGCSTTPLQYCPDADVTRAQMAVFLLRGIHGPAYEPPPATGTVFADVPADHPLAAWIEQLKLEGITGGCSPTLYCPDLSVTRAQMAVFLLRARHGAAFLPPPATGTMFADVPPFHPFADWIEQLAREGITTGCTPVRYCPDALVTRAAMAVFLVRAFGLPI